LLEGSASNVFGQTVGEIAASARWTDPEVIRPVERAYAPDGGVAILRGNLAPRGAVVKKSAVAREMWVHRGPARVFDSMEDAIEAVRENAIAKGSVIVMLLVLNGRQGKLETPILEDSELMLLPPISGG